jgi:hypothetical protein
VPTVELLQRRRVTPQSPYEIGIVGIGQVPHSHTFSLSRAGQTVTA